MRVQFVISMESSEITTLEHEAREKNMTFKNLVRLKLGGSPTTLGRPPGAVGKKFNPSPVGRPRKTGGLEFLQVGPDVGQAFLDDMELNKADAAAAREAKTTRKVKR